MQRAVRKSLCAASMLFLACDTGEAAGAELPAEPFVRVSTIRFESEDTYVPSSVRCGDSFLYVSREHTDRWVAVDLSTGATTVAFPDLPYGPVSCSPSGQWVEFGDVSGQVRIGASDDPFGSAGFFYNNALTLWAENADVLFLLNSEIAGGIYGLAAESPTDESTPITVLYMEPANEKIERTIDRYGGVSIMAATVWQNETNEVLGRAGNGEVVALGFAPSGQIDTVNDVSLSVPAAHTVSLEMNETHVSTYQAYESGKLQTWLRVVDREFFGPQASSDEPVPLLLCHVKNYLAVCKVRLWRLPELASVPSGSQVPLKIPQPIDARGSLIGFHQLSDRSGCLAIWIGIASEPVACLTQTIAIQEMHFYWVAVDIRLEDITLTMYDTDLEAGSVGIDVYRFEYGTLRELGVDG